VTQHDVAKVAGVARKTVSNVINDYEHVRPAVRARVQKAIEELGYQPNRAARNLRTGRSGVVALAVPELDVSYFAELTRHVVEAAERHNLTVMIIQTLGERERELAVLSGLGGQAIDGLIYSPIACTAEEILARTGRFPVVLLGEQISFPELDHVGIDNVAAARAATTHLAGLGRKRIAFIGVAGASHMADLRLEGYTRGLADHGLQVDKSLIQHVDGYHQRDGSHAMEQLLAAHPASPPDAVFCANDNLALGAMHAIYAAGLTVPNDIAIVGFDDIEEAAFSRPTLTSVAPNKRAIASSAVSRLNKLIDEDKTAVASRSDALAEFELVVRESTGG